MSENKKKYAYWMKLMLLQKVILSVRLFCFTLVIFINKNALIISRQFLLRLLEVRLKALRKVFPRCCLR